MVGVRIRGRAERRCGRVVSMGPIEEPFSYSKQQKDPPALPPHRIRFPGNHLLLLEAIAHHNGQVIHPLRLLARETTTAPGRHSSSPSPSTFPRCEVLGGEKKKRKGERGERETDRKTEKWRGEREKIGDTHAHIYFCANYFSSSFVTLFVTRDCYRPFPVNHPDQASPPPPPPPPLPPSPLAGMPIAKQLFRLLANELRLLREVGRIVYPHKLVRNDAFFES